MYLNLILQRDLYRSLNYSRIITAVFLRGLRSMTGFTIDDEEIKLERALGFSGKF